MLREWGRCGSPGTMRLSSYQQRNDAETAEQRTIKRRPRAGLSGHHVAREWRAQGDRRGRGLDRAEFWDLRQLRHGCASV
jgi:predicted DNA-binding WGR domain protein